MRMRVLGCSGGSAPGHHLSGFLLDDVFAVDAGSLTTALEIPAQRAVEAVAVTHAHLDHCWSFPLFLANRYAPGASTCHFYADQESMTAVLESLLNGSVWPDLRDSRVQGQRLVDVHVLPDRAPETILGRYEVTAYPLVHTVPSSAFVVRSGGRAIVLCGDTTTTDEIWKVANATDGLRGVVLECSFPDADEDLARMTGHLTPSLFAAELAKLRKDVPVHVTHVKPEHRARVIDELRRLPDRRIRILSDGQVVDF
jgi:3',5'-cyclic-nucleotide phosphodiesterase